MGKTRHIFSRRLVFITRTMMTCFLKTLKTRQSCSHLKIEKSEGDVLNDFLCHVFRVEFGPELELERRLFFDILAEHLLVELQPGRVVFGVGVLQAEEPDLPETNGFDDLIKELFASRVGLDGELQLRVDGRDANIHWLRHSGECARGGWV